MKKQAWEYGEGNEYLSLDFTVCKRPDGTTYGTAGECVTGKPTTAKSDSKATKTAGKATKPEPEAKAAPAKAAKPEPKEAPAPPKTPQESKQDALLKKNQAARLKSAEASIERMDAVKATKTVQTIGKAIEGGKVKDPKAAAEMATMAYERVARHAAEAGLEPPTITSMVKADTLRQVGIDPDKLNVKMGAIADPNAKKASPEQIRRAKGVQRAKESKAKREQIARERKAAQEKQRSR